MSLHVQFVGSAGHLRLGRMNRVQLLSTVAGIAGAPGSWMLDLERLVGHLLVVLSGQQPTKVEWLSACQNLPPKNLNFRRSIILPIVSQSVSCLPQSLPNNIFNVCSEKFRTICNLEAKCIGR